VAKRETSYEAWLREEGIPVFEGYGIEDVTLLPRKPWNRTGGNGAYIDLKGMEGFTGMYVGEIPAGGALKPESHLYEELIYILQGVGATEIWSAGDEKRKMHFEWHQGSLFAIPLNSRHRLINGSNEPAIFLAVTSAPLMIDLLHNVSFVFGCDYKFGDRFDGQADYFTPTSDRKEVGGFVNWESNFIADARGALVDPSEAKGFGVRITSFDMGESTLVGGKEAFSALPADGFISILTPATSRPASSRFATAVSRGNISWAVGARSIRRVCAPASARAEP
jgi:quercetin dioxygenase-like cupin family protein